MKTLEEIKDEVAIKHGFKDFESIHMYDFNGDWIDDIAKSYTSEVAKEVLKRVAERAKTITEHPPHLLCPRTYIDRSSILNTEYQDLLK